MKAKELFKRLGVQPTKEDYNALLEYTISILKKQHEEHIAMIKEVMK